MSGSVGLLMRYRKEGGCLEQYAGGFLCTCATHSWVAAMENFTSVCVEGHGQRKKDWG